MRQEGSGGVWELSERSEDRGLTSGVQLRAKTSGVG